MGRALAACCIAAFACGCGNPVSDDEKADTASTEPASVAQTMAPAKSGAVSTTTLPLSGAPRKNKHLQLEVYEAGFDEAAPAAPSGLRYFTTGLRGIGLTRAANVEIPIKPFVFAQNDQGCISHPESGATWLKQPFGEVAMFTADKATKGHLTFLVPDDTEQVRVLIAPAGRGLVVAAGDEFTPSWPEPVKTIEDGSTLRVLVLPSRTLPVSLAQPAVGREHVMLDFVVENLKDDQGIEFTTSQQLRLVDSTGKFIQPAAITKQLGCRLDDLDVIPPGHARRFLVVYDIPTATPKRLQYRGFELDEVSVDLP